MQKIKSKVFLVPAVLASLLWFTPALVYAANPAKGAIQSGVCDASGQTTCDTKTANTSLKDTVDAVINILSVAVGIAAVIMIIVAGFKYITSAGNEQSVTSAKKTLLYAIIGLVIVVLAQIIVRFVLGKTT